MKKHLILIVTYERRCQWCSRMRIYDSCGVIISSNVVEPNEGS